MKLIKRLRRSTCWNVALGKNPLELLPDGLLGVLGRSGGGLDGHWPNYRLPCNRIGTVTCGLARLVRAVMRFIKDP